jgi:hypothetical protein
MTSSYPLKRRPLTNRIIPVIRGQTTGDAPDAVTTAGVLILE